MKINRIIVPSVLTLFALAVVPAMRAQVTSKPGPACMQHEQHEHTTQAAAVGGAAQDHHHAEVNQRGDGAMGFSHLKTTHHFILKADGGVIDVAANDPKDTESRDQIRMHLQQIAALFKEGDFSAPMMTHGKTPPGVPVMTQLKSDITYTFEESERGARVRISTANSDALKAVHEFLRFQITDHETGDPLKVEGGRL